MIGSDSPSLSLRQMRLTHLRHQMKRQGIDVLLVRSTDQYLNEYVPTELSRRTYISGFTGSVGDALITPTSAILFVDGRYALQAKEQCPDFDVRVVSLGQSIEEAWLKELSLLKNLEKRVMAIEADRIPISLYDRIQKYAEECNLHVVAPKTALVEEVWQQLGPQKPLVKSKIWSVAPSITGQTTKQRLAVSKEFLTKNKLDAIMVVLLDEIAWLTNIRGDEFPYQATFGARAVAFNEELWVSLKKEHLEHTQKEPGVKYFVDEDWILALKQRFAERPCVIGIDADTTPQTLREEFEKLGAKVILAKSPFGPMKAKKNKEELAHMRSAFARADRVVYKTQQWACKKVTLGETITEADVDNKVREEFLKSGAWGLSFKPICAAGKNGAVIHYGQPNSTRAIQRGELFLLDTGGLYEGGYATDLTRTFLLGDKSTLASNLHKKVFTLVLKGAIAGMSARFPKGTTGIQLDAIVRDTIWRCGVNFEHGTGHGVGINVHESPPRVSTASRTPLEIGHVFSIEPGLYIEGFGGVRIENLCTLVEDPHNPQFVCVLPLTFAPFDHRLIDKKMLTGVEKAFLKYYGNGFKVPHDQLPPLPPLDQSLMDFFSNFVNPSGS